MRPRTTLSVPLGDARGMAEWLRKSGQRPASMAELWTPMPPAAPVAPIVDQAPQPAAQVPRQHEAQESAAEEAAESVSGPDREMEAAKSEDLGSWLSGMAAPAERELFGAASTPKAADMPEAKMPQRSDYDSAGGAAALDAIGSWLSTLGGGKPTFDANYWQGINEQGDRRYDNAVQSAKDDEYRRKALEARQGGGEMSPTQLAAQERTERTRRLWDPESEESQRARAAYIQAGGDPALVDGRSFAEMDGDPAVRATIQRATEEIRGDKGAEEYDRRAGLQFRDWARRNNIDENDARARTIFEDAIARARKMDEEDRAAEREAPKVEATAAKDYGEELRARGVTRARAALDSVLEEMRLQGIDIDAALADPSVVKADVPGYGQTGMAPTAMLSPEGKNMRRAVKRLLDTELRVATGAAAPPSEQDTFASILGVGRMDTDRDLISALAQAKRVLDLQEGYVKEMFPSAPQAKKPSGPRAPKPSGAPPGEPMKTYRHTAKNGKQFEYPLTEKQAAAMRAKGFVLDEVQ